MDAVWVVTQSVYVEETGDTATDLIAIYATEQTAQQHADRHGPGLHVSRETVLTKLRSY